MIIVIVSLNKISNPIDCNYQRMIIPIVVPMKLEPDTDFFMHWSIAKCFVIKWFKIKEVGSNSVIYSLSWELVIKAPFPASIKPPNIVRPLKELVKVVSAPEDKVGPFPWNSLILNPFSWISPSPKNLSMNAADTKKVSRHKVLSKNICLRNILISYLFLLALSIYFSTQFLPFTWEYIGQSCTHRSPSRNCVLLHSMHLYYSQKSHP